MLLRFFTLAFVLLMTTTIFAQTPPIETGVSQSLAKWRSANYSDVRYKLNITLEKGAPLMKGDIEIRVNLTDAGAKNDLILDWRTTQFANDKDEPFAKVVAVNDKAANVLSNIHAPNYFISKEHLVVSQKFLKTGENVIKIEFASPIKTSGAAITRYVDKEDGAEYVYSLFVPSDASTAFPVFDQPDLKAIFQLNLEVPTTWEVVTNTKTFETSDIRRNDTQKNKEIYSRALHFYETEPISTYVFAFAAGDFEIFNEFTSDRKLPKSEFKEFEQKLLSGKSTNIYVRKSQAKKFKQHADEVLRLNREGVKFLEDWFDYKFPFPKYDLVLIPEFPFGGMEHAGATFLREDRVIFPTEPTKNDYITRANVIFHEAAHQWFGDTVTMRWFDDLWLKEGFAEFMAYKTLEKVMPEYNAWKVFYERNKQAAYLTDVTRGTTPIYQEIPNLLSAKSAYGNIVYRKAPSFLRQAEFYLGEDKFQTAVRAFLKKHEFANAEWTDLVKEFEDVAWKDSPRVVDKQEVSKEAEEYWREDIRKSLEKWVKQRGMPLIKDTSSVFLIWQPFEKGRTINPGFFEGRRSQQNILGERYQWTQKVKFLGAFPNEERKILEVTFYEDEGSYDGRFPIFVFTQGNETNVKPLFVFPNYQDYGYGIFLLDEKSRAYVLENIQNEKDDFLRSMMWGSLWDSVRFYELAPEDYVKLVIKNINIESDESTIATLLGRVSTAVNYYLSEEQAKQFAPELEKLLIEKMQNAPTLGQKITFYRAFLSLASSENARTILKEFLKPKTKDQKPIFELKSKDKFDIVTRLIALDDADGLKILAELEKTETDDAAKRYAYAARAGIATGENKLKYWKDFISYKEISESWIESAFGVWNSPKHAELTLPYLEKSLAELPNLKRNRKIFFVNGWLSAFIGGQRSEAALNIVNKFLADNPNLDKDLRLKILENADGLERAVKIRAKFGK